MLGWIRSFFRPREQAGASPALISTTDEDRVEFARAVTELEGAGLRRASGDIDNDVHIASLLEIFSRPLSQVDRSTVRFYILRGSDTIFSNALFADDDCFDVVSDLEYADLILKIARLASPQWRVSDVTVSNARSPGAALDFPGIAKIVVAEEPPCSSFNLDHEKSFDWSLIYRLNERLPVSTQGRFAISLDDNATIVFLMPDEIRKLNELCGPCSFFFEEDGQ